MDAKKFVALLHAHQFHFYTGVPCSYFSSLIEAFNTNPQGTHVPAVREDIAVGVAAGAFLGGEWPVVYMQNSGFGYSLEAFASLPMIYRIPLLVLLSHRGPEDPGMEEHRVMGHHTESILQTFGLKYAKFSDASPGNEMGEIRDYLVSVQQPYFLLIGRGIFQ
jgi:phosphonopyruvate decarboxylase